jgi:hypothetical protein
MSHWGAACGESSQARFGKGRMEKDQQWHLVSRLLHSVRAEGCNAPGYLAN